jgi:RNA-directed DNA polymerase
MQLAANVTSGDRGDWQAINWKRVYQTVKNLRQRIFRASRAGDLQRVRSLQRLMLRCQANVLESVRRVTQVNAGKDTPGVDQRIVTTPEERGRLCKRLSHLDLHQVHPVRRGYIPKRKGRRPLGMPTIVDRCVYAMVKNALEPFWEARFEGSSDGFRPSRGCHDASRTSFTWHCRKPRGHGSWRLLSKGHLTILGTLPWCEPLAISRQGG